MAQHPLTRQAAEEAVAWVQECINEGFAIDGKPSAVIEAARRHKVVPRTLRDRLQVARLSYSLTPVKLDLPPPDTEEEAPPRPEGLENSIRGMLIHSPRTLAEMVGRTKASMGHVLDAIQNLTDSGANIHRVGDRYDIPKHTEQAWVKGPSLEFVSDADNKFICGVVGDNHCGSKYERRDVLADLYDRFADAGVTHVFHTGNFIDGDARFNRHDLLVHGIEQQSQMLADTFPQREGIKTYAVTGDDHEGWYAQREGIDVGNYVEGVMRRSNREDWVNLGFMEAVVTLKNANSGVTANLAVVHPGGGSSYATSYAVQKIIESLEGGEKPAVGFYGHYHKMWCGNIRNVWCLITACCQDQTPFMRGRKIEAHVGGTIVRMEQDPDTGAIVGFTPEMKRYFARGYYSERWSHHGPVTLPERSIGGI